MDPAARAGLLRRDAPRVPRASEHCGAGRRERPAQGPRAVLSDQIPWVGVRRRCDLDATCTGTSSACCSAISSASRRARAASAPVPTPCSRPLWMLDSSQTAGHRQLQSARARPDPPRQERDLPSRVHSLQYARHFPSTQAFPTSSPPKRSVFSSAPWCS